MLDAENPTDNPTQNPAPDPGTPSGAGAAEGESPRAAKKAAAKKAAVKKTTAKKATAKRATKKTGAATGEDGPAAGQPASADAPAAEVTDTPAADVPAKKATAKRAARKAPAKKTAQAADPAPPDVAQESPAEPVGTAPPVVAPLFQAPEPTKAAPRRRKAEPKPQPEQPDASQDQDQSADRPSGKQQSRKKTDDKAAEPAQEQDRDERGGDDDSDDGEGGSNRRRRRRGGRRRRKSGGGDDDTDASSDESGDRGGDDNADDASAGEAAGTRRRRRRRRAGDDSDTSDDPKTVTRVRKPRTAEDEITALSGSTRLEAKKQRRREGRDAGRRRAPIVSEAEFLARREAVDRTMVIRQREDLTQIAVMEDTVLVEHYVARESQTSLIGNVYLGRVQNVLPSMEAAFIDIGKGRNAVLYAGEVNWDALGAKDGQPRKIESVLKSGQPILVQVTKDPIGHKGARLTSQISLPGRFLVYVPDGTTSGISRKLPDTERNRLKTLLKEIVPDTAGVIVRTAAEGASEEELTRDVERLTARWDDISGKIEKGNAPQLLYGEPDLTLKVVRDLFTEDFAKLVISGEDAWDVVDGYVEHVAPDLADRLEKYDGDQDVFAAYRIDEQIAKGLDRKVWLPSGGSLIIDRTEAMTVVDVNTGKFTGSGGNLEETVTKNNLEAAEEIVRQLRLRDIGGIIVVDFIDMVLESNRDLVLRRMVECLGRDRTRHQVAEVTSLGLVQMTRKKIGTGLLEAFSESCEHCSGRGLLVHHEPVETKKSADDDPRRNRRGGRNRGRGGDDSNGSDSPIPATPTPKDVAAVAKPDRSVVRDADEAADLTPEPAPVEPPAAEQPRTRSRRRREERPREQRADSSADLVDDKLATDVDAGEPAVADKPIADESLDATPAEQAAPVEHAAPVEPAPAEPVPPVQPAAPKVVTGVRRRGAARRPAGPPAAVAGESTSSNGAQDDSSAGAYPPGTATGGDGHGVSGLSGDTEVEVSVEENEPATQPHVPIKKKGSRKR